MSQAQRRHRLGTPWKIAVGLAIGLSALSALVAIDIGRIYSGIDRVAFSPTHRDSNSTNYLFIGSDSRAAVRTIAELEQFGSPDAQAGERADIMLLLHLPVGGKAVLLAIPRDLLIDVPGEGDQRLTLLYDQGVQKLADGLCTSLGIGVDHFVAIDFKGLERVVDSIGGIDVDIYTAIRSASTGLELDAGVQRINGSTALQLARTRTGEQMIMGRWMAIADGAELRMRNAEAILRGIASRVKGMTAPWDLRRLADSTNGHIRIDDGMGIATLMDLTGTIGKSLEGEITRVPARTVDGETPVAVLGPEAGDVLRALGAGDAGTCETR